MPSLFDSLFGSCAAPFLMDYQGDSETVSYQVNGVTVSGIMAIIGHADVVEVEGGDGTIRKVWRRPLHFMRDEASKWKGIDDPQFKGTFTIKGETWKLADRDTISIEGSSETMVTVNVTRKLTVHKGQKNLREYS